MEFPPEEWDVFPGEEFNSAAPRAAGALNMELLVQARPNGRMLDHFRIGLSGSRILDARFALADLLSFQAAADWSCRMQTWPKDVDLRRNMMTTGWKDLATLIASKDVVITLAETNELVASERVQQAIQENGAGAAVRFAVTVGEDMTVNLQLQGMPAPANTLMGKPAYRGYEC
jgi:hypothetical protein